MGLNIAIQKSGRLHDETISLLKSAGLKVDKSKDQLRADIRGFDASVFFLRNSDIPRYLQDGVADLAVLGENTIIEKEAQVDIVERLGFSKCHLSIAVPKGTAYGDASWLQGKRIATSYQWRSLLILVLQMVYVIL